MCLNFAQMLERIRYGNANNNDIEFLKNKIINLNSYDEISDFLIKKN